MITANVSGRLAFDARDKQLGVLSTIDKTPNEPAHNTQNEIAADLGWSTGKVAMAEGELI